jgi:DNA-binding transcriptional regulator YiaG
MADSQKVKEFRERNDLTLEEAGRMFDVSWRTVWNWEHQVSRVPERIKKIVWKERK